MVYRPTARVLAVLELLQSYGRMSGSELARRLEVDIRTVRDYIETLQDLGIPVEAERGRYGAYRLRPGYKLPPLIFSEEESLALTLSLLIARQAGLATTEPAIETVLAKVERVLPEATRQRIQAMEQSVLFENSTFQNAPKALTVAVLSSAVQSRRSVRMEYSSATSEVSERVFDAYGVVYHEGLWYTIGYCHLRHGQRLFRLDRIRQLELLDQTFIPPPNFQALVAVQQALTAVPSVWQIEVWFETSLAEAPRQLGISKTYFKEEGNGVVMRGEVPDLEWLASRLAGVGARLIIRQPAELRKVLGQYARRLASYAEATG